MILLVRSVRAVAEDAAPPSLGARVANAGDLDSQHSLSGVRENRLGRSWAAGEGGVVGVGAARAARRELAGRRFAQPEPAVGCQVRWGHGCALIRAVC